VTGKNDRKAPPAGDRADAKALIRAAAEQLFGTQGIDGPSLREIGAKAGQKNNFAVQYHFGTRDDLVRTIFDHRMWEMEATRGRMIEEASAECVLDDVRTLVEIVYRPQLELQRLDGSNAYAAFLIQFLLRTPSRNFGLFSPERPPCLTQTLELLRGKLSHLSDSAAQRRLVGCSLRFAHILLNQGDSLWPAQSDEDFDTALEDTLDQIVHALTVPLPS
jgi:AcrR family transcriptional regulator